MRAVLILIPGGLRSIKLELLYLAPLMAVFTGSLVYCVLAILGAVRYRLTRIPRLTVWPPVSILRPLSGAEDNTENNLRSLFEQRYPEFEVLLSVHELTDPAAPLARRIMAEYPHIVARLVVAGVSPFPNAKVWSLRALQTLARNEVIVMTDSDILLPPNALTTIVAELEQPNTGLVTCPYRATAGRRFWSRLEAVGLNTEFLAGLLTARLLNGVDFAIGCTIATRKAELAAIGGLETLQRYLAEDFMMGNLVHRRKRKVILSHCIIEHYIGSDRFFKNWKHRLRWARSTRRSRRLGYIGELFTKTTAISLLLAAVPHGSWGFALIGLMFRAGVQFSTAIWVLDDPLVERFWWLLPLEDLASFLTWILGFFGKTILWRGRKLTLEPDGSFSG